MITDLAEALDPALFAARRLNITPNPSQIELLRLRSRRTIVNCTRQWGKSTIVSILAVHRALTQDKCLVLVAGPSLRQTAEFLSKAEEHVRSLELPIRRNSGHPSSLLFPPLPESQPHHRAP